MSLAYNELYKINEPGAMNLIMLETDGLPNTLVYDFYTTPGTLSTLALNTTSACVDNPAPHPRSTTRRRGPCGTRASRSIDGRFLSSPKRP